MLKKYVVLCCVVMVCLFPLTASAVSKSDVRKAVQDNRADQILQTQGLVRIPSFNNDVSAAGDPLPAQGVLDSLTYVMDLAESWGMKAVVHEGWQGSTPARRGPLYGYVEYGPEDAAEMVMALGHLDTVPPGDASLWTLGGAYEAKIVKVDGEERIIGRGVFDDKAPALAALYSLKAIKDAGVPLNRRIRVFFGTTEDNGGWICTSAYATDAKAGNEEWPTLGFSPDSGSFQPTYIEKSSVNVTARNTINNAANAVKLTAMDGGTASNAVSDKCYATLEGSGADLQAVKLAMEQAINLKGWGGADDYPIELDDSVSGKLNIEVTGRASHSGEAWLGVGANNRMMYLLSVAPETAGDWQGIAEKVAALLPPDENADNMGTALGIHEGDTTWRDLVTVCMGFARLETDSATGAQNIYNAVNIRYADVGADVLTGTKHRSGETIKDIVQLKFDVAGLTATTSGGSVPYTVPMDSEIIVKLQDAYKEITGVSVTPCITIGSTYAAAWRSQTLSPNTEETFGNRMVSWGIDGGIGMHEANESMSVDKLIEGTEIMALAMISLADGELTEDKGSSGSSGCDAGGLGLLAFGSGTAAVAYRMRRR